MRNVTAEYHNANKADTRSSDFLIVSDTGFSLHEAAGSVGWSYKNLSGNELEQGMLRCSKKASENLSDYGCIIFKRYDDLIEATTGISICFDDSYPTEYEIYYYTSEPVLDIENGVYLPDAQSAVLTNNSRLLYISNDDIFTQGRNWNNLHEIRFYFRKWSKQGVNPVILFTTYNEPAVFTKDDLMSVDITLETDITAQSIPYNTYACTVIDEVDTYNPLLQDSKIYDFTHGQKFRFFNFEKSVESLTDDLSLFTHEVCPVGVAYFRQAKQQGTAVNFDFIDIVEKYDKTPLSEKELELSSHFIKRNVKEYLTVLFGNDLDTSLIPEDLESITPFYKESKMQILLYLAQLMHKYLYVTTSGVISFKGRSDWTEDFCIDLEQSYQNPTIEKTYENNGVEVSVYAYSSSQNTELAFNRIEFIFDGETKVYYNGSTLYDAETEEEIFRIPKFDFNELQMKYVFNDVYDRNSLFSIFLGIPLYMSEVQDSIAEENTSIEYENETLDVTYRFAYCDTHMTVTMTSEEKTIESSNENYYDIVESMSAFLLFFNQLQGSKVTSSANKVQRKKYTSDNSGSAIAIENPVITELDTAKDIRDWIYNQFEASAYTIDTDWRGDCSLELGDESTAKMAISQNGTKDYESKYIGTVTKNIIEYNGALKMQTTLVSPSQKRWNDVSICSDNTKISTILIM